MPYKFNIQNFSNSYLIKPIKSQLDNEFIHYTAQVAPREQIADPQNTWVTSVDPTIQQGAGVSPAIMVYNPYYNLFLGDSEQLVPMGSPNSNANGTVAGSFTFSSTDTSFKFVFKTNQAGYYTIYLDDTSITDKSTLTKRLVCDRNNKNRVMITDATIVPNNLSADDRWIINFVN